MKILSFDVGIKNLAFCLTTIDNEHVKFDKWNCVEIPTDIKKIIKHLNDLFDSDIDNLDVVLIEKQPNKNPKMKCVEIVLTTYFNMKECKKVIVYSAKHKLGKDLGRQVKGKHNYRERKKLSIVKCSLFLKEYQMESELELFTKSKKKDDLSDCFLQMLSYIKHSFYASDKMNEIDLSETKIICRKPTDKQIRTGNYSICNLKYLMNCTSEDVLKSDVRVIKAIKKFFNGDWDCAKNKLK